VLSAMEQAMGALGAAMVTFLPPLGIHTLLLTYSRHSSKQGQKQRRKPREGRSILGSNAETTPVRRALSC